MDARRVGWKIAEVVLLAAVWSVTFLPWMVGLVWLAATHPWWLIPYVAATWLLVKRIG